MSTTTMPTSSQSMGKSLIVTHSQGSYKLQVISPQVIIPLITGLALLFIGLYATDNIVFKICCLSGAGVSAAITILALFCRHHTTMKEFLIDTNPLMTRLLSEGERFEDDEIFSDLWVELDGKKNVKITVPEHLQKRFEAHVSRSEFSALKVQTRKNVTISQQDSRSSLHELCNNITKQTTSLTVHYSES